MQVIEKYTRFAVYSLILRTKAQMQVLVTLTHANFGGNPLYQATKHLNGEKRNVELDAYLLLIQLFLYPVLGRIFKSFLSVHCSMHWTQKQCSTKSREVPSFTSDYSV